MLLIVHAILAGLAVVALVAAPRSTPAAALIAAAAAADLALGAPARAAIEVVAPLAAFIAAALTLAALVERSGLMERVACVLAARAKGSGLALYVLVCGLCAVLTATVSLDGAVVLMVPLLLVLARRAGAAVAPLFLGVVVVANAASIAVPQGNPTNLVLMGALGLSPGEFVGHMLVPGLAAAAVCAVGVALFERRALRRPVRILDRLGEPLSIAERHAAAALAGAAVVAWAAPLAGIAPWWPFTGAVALALATARRRPRLAVPWRIAVQVAGLVVVIGALGLPAWTPDGLGLAGMLALAAVVGAASALANNLPVSVCAGSLLGAGTSAYAAAIGLALGSLAMRQGSVATLVAAQLAGSEAPSLPVRRLAPLAAAGGLVATVFVWAMR